MERTNRKPNFTSVGIWLAVMLLIFSQVINLPDHRLYRKSLQRADSLQLKLDEAIRISESMEVSLRSMQTELDSFGIAILEIRNRTEVLDLDRKSRMNRFLQERNDILKKLDSLQLELETTR